MPESLVGSGIQVPVSILTNKSNVDNKPSENLESIMKLKNENIIESQIYKESSPLYHPVDNHSYINPQLLAHKLKLITQQPIIDEPSPEKSTDSNSSITNTPLIGTAVSFTIPNITEKISHRGSISTKPSIVSKSSSTSAGTASGYANNTGLITPIDLRSDDILYPNKVYLNQTFHSKPIQMPGDFVYFEANTPLSSIQSSHESTQLPLRKNYINNKAIIGEDNIPQVPFTQFFQKQDDKKIHILIGATGSVATIKVPMIIDKLLHIYSYDKVSIQLVVTKRAEHFLKGLKINEYVKIWRDEDEWFGFKRMGDPVLHTELRRWADLFLLAPLSANTLGKLANGICDNLLTSLIRTWSPSTPIIAALAMNTFMYIHPMTKKHLNMLEEASKFIEVLKPVEKVLVCGDIGMGGMREWTEIVEIVVKRIAQIHGNEDHEKIGDEEEHKNGTESDNSDYGHNDSDDDIIATVKHENYFRNC